MDLELGIQLEERHGQRILSFAVQDYRPEGNPEQLHFEPITLTNNPQEFFAELYRQVEGLPKDEGLNAEDVLEELQDYGSYLYHQLLPPELGRFLELHQGCSLQIHSTEPWIPWEWVRLEQDEEGRCLPGPFLCEAFDLSRWLAGRPQPLALPVSRMALVALEAWGLDLQGEVAFLKGLRQSDRQVQLVAPRLRTLRTALASGKFDSLHFCGHGDAPGRADQAELHLEDNTRFTPVNLQGEARNLGRSQPLVFLNACRTGRGGFSLTGLGGWAGHFLAAGAGAFIGTHWTVSNSKAEAFSQHFYQAFLEGAPIARAFRTARNAIREPGDPSWLAYTLYAHPEACCVPEGSEATRPPFSTTLPGFLEEADPILQIQSPRWPGDPSNASSLLNADYCVVPFHGREHELGMLRGWCVDGATDSQILLYTGPGGMGKTRLALEACEDLREKGWRAGFIPREILDLDVDHQELKQTVWPRLTQGTRPIFAVMDYSETHHAKLVSLLEILATPGGPRLRLLLLSREAGDWWYSLKRKRGSVGSLLRGQRAHHDSLGPLASSLDERGESYWKAAKAFAHKLDKPIPDQPPMALGNSCFDRVLLLHMMALASVEGVQLKSRDSDDGILDYILDRERRLWENQLAARELPRTFHKGLGQVVAEVYSRGGVASHEEALTIFRQLPFFEGRPADLLDEAATLLHECYPGEDCWIEAIQPDLLGEHLIMREHENMGSILMDDIFGSV